MLDEGALGGGGGASGHHLPSHHGHHGHHGHHERHDSLKAQVHLRASPFKWGWQEGLHRMVRYGIDPFFYSLNFLLAQFVATTDQSHTTGRRVMLFLPLLLVAVITAPFFLVFYPLHALMCLERRPFAFAYHREGDRKVKAVAKSNFSIVSANCCLRSEYHSRKHNLRRSFERARHIGVSVSAAELHRHEELPDRHVRTRFPKSDFICWQEIFDPWAAEQLRRLLNPNFPYCLYDVGDYRFSSYYFLVNSGLMFSSKYPILACEYYRYRNGAKGDNQQCRGVLMVKVFLVKARAQDNRQTVGFIFNTHLSEDDAETRSLQLDQLQNQTKDFRKRNFDQKTEIVGFQVLAGGMAFDNVSGEDERNRAHPLLTQYEDPCTGNSGRDHEWAVGSVLYQPLLHDPAVSAAMYLKTALLDPVLRAEHIGERRDDGLEPEARQVPGFRRVDRILLQHPIPPQLTRRVVSCSTVTAFANYCDHLALAVTFSCGEHGTDAHMEQYAPGSINHTPSITRNGSFSESLSNGHGSSLMTLVNTFGRVPTMQSAASHARPPVHYTGSSLLRAAPSMARPRPHSLTHGSSDRHSRLGSSHSETEAANNIGAWLQTHSQATATATAVLDEVNIDTDSDSNSSDEDLDKFVEISEV